MLTNLKHNISLSNFPKLESITFKNYVMKNVNSIEISNNPLLSSMTFADGSYNPTSGTGVFLYTTKAEFSSILFNFSRYL